MKRYFGKITKTAIVMGLSVILVTLVMNAGDNIGNFSNSLVALLFGLNKPKNPCPDEMAFVATSEGKSFCIDKYEASANESCPFRNPLNQAETRANLERTICQPVSMSGVIPWRNISQNQAEVACAKAGKRLPANKEFYKASLGTPDPSFSWGEKDCNLGKRETSLPDAAGSREKCVSSSGVYDMIGNVWEWVEGTITDGAYQGRSLADQGFVKAADSEGIPVSTDAEQADLNYNEDYFWIDKSGSRGMFRGGYWGSDSKAGIYSVHAISPPSFTGIGVGFRCVKNINN